MILQHCGERFGGQTRHKLNFFFEIQSVTSDASLTLHITQSTPSLLSSMTVAASARTGKLVRIEGTMEGAKYRRILDENLLE